MIKRLLELRTSWIDQDMHLLFSQTNDWSEKKTSLTTAVAGGGGCQINFWSCILYFGLFWLDLFPDESSGNLCKCKCPHFNMYLWTYPRRILKVCERKTVSHGPDVVLQPGKTVTYQLSQRQSMWLRSTNYKNISHPLSFYWALNGKVEPSLAEPKQSNCPSENV